MPRSTARSKNRGRTGNGTAEGTEGTDRRDRERTRNNERGGERRRGGQQGAEGKGNRLWGARQSTGSYTGEEVLLDSALTTSGTGGTEDWSRHSG